MRPLKFREASFLDSDSEATVLDPDLHSPDHDSDATVDDPEAQEELAQLETAQLIDYYVNLRGDAATPRPVEVRGSGYVRAIEAKPGEDVPFTLPIPELTPGRTPLGCGRTPTSSPYTPTPKPRQKPHPGDPLDEKGRDLDKDSTGPEQFYRRKLSPTAWEREKYDFLPAARNMSKPKDSQSETYHQEYIASSRYRNDLPPPDMPPKLLDIPHEGLEHFLTPGYASNLARREELNVDVDAEGGMPIDLVGIPGLHLGDESAIMAPENPPPIDPADLPLLMTLEQLKNPAPKDANVSFLRRTQYISSGGAGGNRTANAPGNAPKARPPQQEKSKLSHDDPVYVKKYIQKGFDIAHPESKHTGEDTTSTIKGHAATKAELDAWAHPVHPDNPKLRPVGVYPVLPDMQGFADPGGYVQFKFDKAPVPADAGKRDKRMDVSVLHPSAPNERICQEHATKVSLHRTNPDRYPDPGPVPFDYDLFVPEKKEATSNVIASLNSSNPNRDDPGLYTHESDGNKFHRYDRVRTYATGSQTLSTEQRQRDLALAIHDPAEIKDETQARQKAAYYYPIIGKTRLKQERNRTIAKAGLAPTSAKTKEDQVDQIQMTIRDPDEAETYKRSLHRAAIDPKFAQTLPPPPVGPEDELEAEPEGRHEGEPEGQHEDREMSVDNAAASPAAGAEEQRSDE